jgi:PAS domain S-box-containing protein
LPNATAIVDNKLNFTCTSIGWEQLFLFPKKAVYHNNQVAYFQENDGQWDELLKKCVTQGKELGYRSTISIDDMEKCIDWTFKPLYKKKNSISGAIITALDISDVIEKEVIIKKLDTLLETKSEISKVGTWEFDLESNKLSWSKMTKIIHEVPEDYEPDVDTAIDFYKLGHSRNKISMLVHNSLETGDKFHERLQIVTHKGNDRWIISSGKPLFKNGKIIKLLGTFQDVDEQVKTEIKIRENEKLLYTLVDNLPLNVYIKDLDSRKILVNKSECDFIGVDSPNEILGKNNFDLYDEEMAQRLREEDLKVMKNQSPMLAKEEVVVKKDGTEVPMLISKIPLKDIKGQTYALLGISMDISTLKQKEDELKNLIDVTSIQNKKLVNFAHIVSHNLRSHTANFSMLLEFLNNENDENEKNRIVRMLTKASNNLLSTLDNLNEVVKINTNTNISRERINLKKSFESVHENLVALFETNNVVFKNHIPSKLNVYGIPAYVESIILNLLTNAVKYKHPNKNPKITVTAKKEGNKIVFSVEDNGIGIDLNKNGDKLFGMYKTFHNNDDARGIGLYITKNQIEAMGGSIIACSELNIGTTFKVYFNEGY